ncbi:hypothetical protein [Ramlibacter sp. WS9]|uniref:hypothetical protein n=1 Tax=Ramlibacter sp. WS9 TaxID=1882741 RepID=UPI00114186E3|nr:hypothetical protein [Ramlibacter sp. WS9]ROZ75371.1 hypothetical protein EEB15_15545 [Ramlibacter sp. WS9]
MKAIIFTLILATLALTQACGHRHPSTADLSTIADGKSWRVTHTDAQTTEVDGKRAVRLVAEGDSANGIVGLALPRALSFSTGTIEIDLKGRNLRQRSFLGVAFNVIDEKTFEAVYFRPFNFQAAEPIRNRSVQYIAWPVNTWEHLRRTAPGQFENAVKPVPDPDGWFHARIEVTDSHVRVFVNDAKEPSLVTRRLSAGGVQRPVGLFVDSGDGHYSNLTVMPLKSPAP